MQHKLNSKIKMDGIYTKKVEISRSFHPSYLSTYAIELALQKCKQIKT